MQRGCSAGSVRSMTNERQDDRFATIFDRWTLSLGDVLGKERDIAQDNRSIFFFYVNPIGLDLDASKKCNRLSPTDWYGIDLRVTICQGMFGRGKGKEEEWYNCILILCVASQWFRRWIRQFWFWSFNGFRLSNRSYSQRIHARTETIVSINQMHAFIMRLSRFTAHQYARKSRANRNHFVFLFQNMWEVMFQWYCR